MITKGQISQLIRSMAAGGQPSSNYKIDSREVSRIADMAYSTLISKHYAIARTDGDDIDGAFIRSYPETEIKYNKTRDEYYICLPAKMVKLYGGNDKGLRQISGNKGQKTPFTKLQNGAQGASSPLESSGLIGKIGYYVESDKVYFVDNNKDLDGNVNLKIRGMKSVMVKMVASIDEFDDDDELPIPSDMELELITSVQQIFREQKQTPVDDNNDGHSR